MSYSVYCHKNKTNGKMYFGITKMNPARRWLNGEGYKTSRHFYFAIQKYGWNNFEHKILFENLTKEDACEKEIELIKLYKTTDSNYGYNVSTGGESGAAGVIKDRELVERIASLHRGKKVSEETRHKMSLAAKGRTFSPETIEKMRQAKKGMKVSEERIKKMIKTKREKGQYTMSQETKNKLHEIKEKKKIYCFETDKIYDSIQGASKELGLFATNICAVCKGKHKHCKGYHFKYAEEL